MQVAYKKSDVIAVVSREFCIGGNDLMADYIDEALGDLILKIGDRLDYFFSDDRGGSHYHFVYSDKFELGFWCLASQLELV